MMERLGRKGSVGMRIVVTVAFFLVACSGSRKVPLAKPAPAFLVVGGIPVHEMTATDRYHGRTWRVSAEGRLYYRLSPLEDQWKFQLHPDGSVTDAKGQVWGKVDADGSVEFAVGLVDHVADGAFRVSEDTVSYEERPFIRIRDGVLKVYDDGFPVGVAGPKAGQRALLVLFLFHEIREELEYEEPVQPLAPPY